MKGYFITDAQMEDLHRRIELAYANAKSGRNTGVRTFDDLFRSINYEVRGWQKEVGKS
jgi:hypothetical protein